MRACELAGLRRSTWRYRRRARTDDSALRERIHALAAERPRFGYRRLHVLLRREGRTDNRKRVYRVYRAGGLAVRSRNRKRLRFSRPKPPAPVTRPNERWSMDFVHDYLEGGRAFRTLNVIDAFTHECFAIEVDHMLPAARVVQVLDRLLWQHGLPESLRVDNGPEFISMALDTWAHRHGVKLDFIQPGKPTQNAHVESFNGRFRDECLLVHPRFPTLARARAEIELWRVDYNTRRPHSSIAYETPKSFGDKARRSMPPSAGAAAAIFGDDRDRPARHLAHDGVKNRVEVN